MVAYIVIIVNKNNEKEEEKEENKNKNKNNIIINNKLIRKFLKEKLPEYMIPSYFILIDKLPLTPNGKIDRKSLPEPFDLINKKKEEGQEKTITLTSSTIILNDENNIDNNNNNINNIENNNYIPPSTPLKIY